MCAQQHQADWLCPFPDERGRRGFLKVELEEYLKLLDWRGAQIWADKPGKIPADLDPILTRLEADGEVWLDTVEHFGSRFYRVGGSLKRLVGAVREAG